MSAVLDVCVPSVRSGSGHLHRLDNRLLLCVRGPGIWDLLLLQKESPTGVRADRPHWQRQRVRSDLGLHSRLMGTFSRAAAVIPDAIGSLLPTEILCSFSWIFHRTFARIGLE